MGNECYCPDCGAEEIECDCNIDESIEEVVEGCFRWEYQHEGCSYYGTKFKRVMPDSDT